jgi:deoxycytidylate deaminase
MQLLKNTLILDEIMKYLVDYARQSTCHRSKCGSIIVDDYTSFYFKILGVGYNSMPCNEEGECFKDSLSSTFKSDKTCCIHAEQRAIMDCLKKNPSEIVGSQLFFIRLDDENNPKISGTPYCSICSKMALDVGIANFHLWHDAGWTAYEAEEYNKITFQYQ